MAKRCRKILISLSIFPSGKGHGRCVYLSPISGVSLCKMFNSSQIWFLKLKRSRGKYHQSVNWWIIRRLAKLMIPVLTQKSSLYDLKLYAINLLKYFKRHIWLNFDNNVRKNRMRSLVKFFLSKSGAFNYMTTTKDERMLRCYSFYTVHREWHFYRNTLGMI